MSSVNAFFLHTPFQRFIAERMIARMPAFRGVDCVALVDRVNDGCAATSPRWKSVDTVSPAIGMSFLGSGARAAKRAADSFLASLRGYDHVQLLLSNLDYPISNVLFRSVRDSGGRITLASLPEGLASVVPTRPRWTKRLKNLSKMIYGVLVGSRFTWYGADVAGLDFAEHVYTLFPSELDIDPTRKLEIRPEWIVNPGIRPEPATLVAGQDFSRYIGMDRQGELSRALIDFVIREESGRRIYKPHHDQNDEVSGWFRDAGFETLETQAPIEEVFLDSPVRRVVASNSSALLHLKQLYGDAVECVSFRGFTRASGWPNDRPERLQQARELYQRVGVRLVD